MGASTRWRDNTDNSFEEVIARIKQPVENDERTKTIYWINISCRPVFKDNEIQSLNLDDKTVRFAAYHYRFDQITVQDNPDDDRVLSKNGLIVVYEYNGSIFYIVDQNSKAQKLLRKVLSYTGKHEIEKYNFDFTEDFFVWLVYRVYNSDASFVKSSLNGTKTLKIMDIIGIRGDTEDFQSKVSATGESVMNIISTLAFLLESRQLRQLVAYVSYTDHEVIGIRLTKSTVEFERPYNGIYALSEATTEEILSRVYMLLYIEILPLLEKSYRDSIKNGWDEAAHVDFLKSLRKSIMERIDEKIKFLENRLTQ